MKSNYDILGDISSVGICNKDEITDTVEGRNRYDLVICNG